MPGDTGACHNISFSIIFFIINLITLSDSVITHVIKKIMENERLLQVPVPVGSAIGKLKALSRVCRFGRYNKPAFVIIIIFNNMCLQSGLYHGWSSVRFLRHRKQPSVYSVLIDETLQY